MLSLLGPLLPSIISVIGRFIPDPAARAQAQAELTKAILDNEAQIISAARDVVVSEVSSDSKLAKNWRPILMYLLMLMIVWLVVVAPMFGNVEETIKAIGGVPDAFWNLLIIGMGGYIVGRSGEKIAGSIASSMSGKSSPQ